MSTNKKLLLIAMINLMPLTLMSASNESANYNGIGISEVDHISKQGLAWWFTALACIAVTSWTFSAKWLLAQLESQRKSNNEQQNMLITILKDDHANAVKVLVQVTDVITACTKTMGETSVIMGKVVEKMAQQERVWINEQIAESARMKSLNEKNQ